MSGSHLTLTSSGVRSSVLSANIFPATLNTECSGAEREVLYRPDLRQTARAQLSRVHTSNRRTAGREGVICVRSDTHFRCGASERPATFVPDACIGRRLSHRPLRRPGSRGVGRSAVGDVCVVIDGVAAGGAVQAPTAANWWR